MTLSYHKKSFKIYTSLTNPCLAHIGKARGGSTNTVVIIRPGQSPGLLYKDLRDSIIV